MTKMVAMPIYGKKYNLLWNWLAETWYTALGTWLLPSSNDDPRLTIDLFTQRWTLVLYAFVWEKCLNGGLLRNVWSLWYKSWYILSTKWLHDSIHVPEVSVILYLFKVIQNETGSQVSDTGGAQLCEWFCFWQLGKYRHYNSATVIACVNEPFSPSMGNSIS